MTKYLDERGDPVSKTHDADREKFSAQETRQGSLGVRVLAVLTGGLFLALLAWGAVELWGEINDNDQATQTEQVQPAPSPEQTGSVQAPAPADGQEASPTDRDPTAESGTGGPSQQISPDGTEK
ncbi:MULTISPECIES: hypothetical protein [Sinorhizobium]|uniref:Uncharacterized protein n=1 Tax=Sinorhizobium psoraleae TaxID=520838 RepID=A0ABT4KC52_9HYPH|nr:MULTISPECIES: hypothetical protein [Sinorhizobium]MCZ4089539.1 hypothetical protein [Sinorhizobium psoraleae]MDK1388027.1 hypothetical protein [Sinorhizobium sp. 7-81]MDK1492130.1 hypothetical protein [Sinorhizobium sp. 8-89]NRP73488.1 hypothetical protein [Sinorhizobium psoraleae]